MPSRIEDYALVGDTQGGGPGGEGRFGRLALPPPVRLARLLRRPAGGPGQRPVADRARGGSPGDPPPVSGRHAHPGDRVRDGFGGRPADRLHAPAGPAPDLVRIVEGVSGDGPDAHGPDPPVRLRVDRPLGRARRLRPAGDRRARRDPDRLVRRAQGGEPLDRRGLRGRGRPSAPVRPDLVPLARGGAGQGSTPRRPSRTPRRTGPSGHHGATTRGPGETGWSDP